MKRFLLLLMSFVFTIAIAQEEEVSSGAQSSVFNKWSVDVNGGLSRPTTPFTKSHYVNTINFFHLDLGVRYMFNTKFGLKADVGYDSYENPKGGLKFDGKYKRANLQAVANIGRMLNFEEFIPNGNIQFHSGLGYSILNTDKFKGNDEMLNVIIGVTAQYKLTNRVALNADFSMINNINQTYTFDGQPLLNGVKVIEDRGFNGTLYNASVGLSFYFGKNDTHADWSFEMVDEKQAELEGRIAEMETMMNDTDRDGVPDYLDVENNTTNGVAVDAKGRAVDLNNNGVPDELERYVEQKTKEAVRAAIPQDGTSGTSGSSGRSGKSPNELINQGYVNVFFDTDSFYPKSSSTNDIYFVVNYLKENPSASVDIIGTADVRGNNEYNNNLSKKRAERVKSIVEKAGIDASRLNIVAQGEESLGNGSENLSLVRKVTFRLK